MSQNLGTRMEFDRVVETYVAPVQASGLPVGVIEAHVRESSTPDDLRRSLTRALQATLPRSVPTSVRSDASRMPDSEFFKTEQRVKAAVIEQAHQSPTLRPVITRDRSGREITEFYGQKKAWMSQYSAPALLMRRCGARTF